MKLLEPERILLEKADKKKRKKGGGAKKNKVLYCNRQFLENCISKLFN
jgi:hypothetical protein